MQLPLVVLFISLCLCYITSNNCLVRASATTGIQRLPWTTRKDSKSTPRVPVVVFELSTASASTATKRQNEASRRVTDEQARNEDHEIAEALSRPIIDEQVWDRLTGSEFQNNFPRILSDLAETGRSLAVKDEPNEWIDWKKQNSKQGEDGDDESSIQVWTGKSKRSGYGSESPWIKTRSTIPFSAEEMVDLLMDSSKVKIYNQWSVGRKDCWVAPTTKSTSKVMDDDMFVRTKTYTKIVKNRTQPPLGSKQMVSTTLLHARPILPSPSSPLENAPWLVVSRAVGGTLFDEPQDSSVGRSDILLGVNLLQPSKDDPSESCTLTAITHVYSSAVPLMLAERLGVKSAIKFVQDIRNLRKQKVAA